LNDKGILSFVRPPQLSVLADFRPSRVFGIFAMRKPTWRRRYLSRRRRRLSDGDVRADPLRCAAHRASASHPGAVARTIADVGRFRLCAVDAAEVGARFCLSVCADLTLFFECDWSAAYRPWRRAVALLHPARRLTSGPFSGPRTIIRIKYETDGQPPFIRNKYE
jgi:hypothetical protein